MADFMADKMPPNSGASPNWRAVSPASDAAGCVLVVAAPVPG
jgi:hypothetical protein